MAEYENGRIPPEALRRLSVGGSLLAGAAASFERWRVQAAEVGRTLTIASVADAYRTFEQQEDLFLKRYEVGSGPGPFGDVREYKNVKYYRARGAAVAVPGTSNHGKGLAVDIANTGAFGGSFHNWLSSTGPALGWTNTEGRSVNEPWHWVYGGSNNTPPTEDDMTPDQAAKLDAIFALLTPGQAGVKFDGDIFARLKRLEDKADATPTMVWSYKNAALNGTRDVYNIINGIKNKLSA